MYIIHKTVLLHILFWYHSHVKCLSWGLRLTQWWQTCSGKRHTHLAPTTHYKYWIFSLQWRQNDHDCVSNHQPPSCLLNRLFRRRSKKTSKLRVTGLCAGNSPETGEFAAQRASNAENVSIWWRHHVNIWRSAIWSSSLEWCTQYHDDIIKWKHFPHYWHFLCPRSLVNSPLKGQWRGALMSFFYLRLNNRLSKHSRRRWFETPLRSLWRHCNDALSCYLVVIYTTFSSNCSKILSLVLHVFSSVPVKQPWKTWVS